MPRASEASSLLGSRGPPPAYSSIQSDNISPDPAPATRRVRPRHLEDRSTRNQGKQDGESLSSLLSRKVTPGRIIFALSFLWVITTTVFIIASISLRSRDILDPIERENIRREWRRERLNHDTEHKQWNLERNEYNKFKHLWELESNEYDKFKELWNKEQQQHDLELAEWARQRKEWESEKARQQKEWESEKALQQKEWESEKAHQQKEWESEKAHQQKEWESEKTRQQKQWDLKKARQQKQWDLEKARHEAEDQRWEKERWERMRLYWGPLWRNDHCHSYGTREYTARLWNIAPGADGIAACEQMPMTINRRSIFPSECEDRGRDGIHGRWLVDFGEVACQPHWSTLNNMGCVGDGAGLHRFEARLENIQSGDDWQTMCDTTPNVVNGITFKSPTSCENRVSPSSSNVISEVLIET
ncbi:hypothetical protein BDY19DRAFT_123587 [Irpex rosettiformis]|uniref:Uncharacterized protein n=1 Tax=Irpex rosettiformis TaxID=378272 RepID=A0ACB8U4A7_9APHY|nr:hypothetical protein BDY19DRAFT_123587 [Irpex rosettiformis]